MELMILTYLAIYSGQDEANGGLRNATVPTLVKLINQNNVKSTCEIFYSQTKSEYRVQGKIAAVEPKNLIYVNENQNAK